VVVILPAVPDRRALFLAFGVSGLVMVAWGATPVATRLATEEMEPLVVALLRTMIAGVVAAPIVAGLGMAPPSSQRGRLLLLASGVSGFVAFPVLFTLGQDRTSAMHGGMILASLSIITGLYAAALARRRPRSRWLVGCAIALAGEAAIIGSRAGSGGAEPTVAGDLLVLVAALLVAMGYVAGAMLSLAGYRSLATTFWGVVIGAALVAAPLGWSLARDGIPSGDAAGWGSIVFLATVTSIVGYVGWYWALARGGIARIGTIQFFQPFSGLVLAALILDERFTAPLVAGAVAVLVGVTIAQRAA
jgi:drug/metabolite transporter (DMT)-like permease